MSTAEKAMGRLTARTGERVLGVTALAAVGASAVMSLVVSPPDVEQGELIRLMYVHVPAAWVAYLSFGVVFVASLAYLKTKRIRWDRLAAASAEVGVVFTALTIVLGSIWAKPVWGTWWTWDPRLTTTAIMLLIYLGYLAVRRIPDNPARKARWSAVVGIVGFADVPIVHLSVRWWRSLHQAPARLLGVPDLAPAMGAALGIGFLAFTLVYLYFVALRLRVGRLEDRVVAEVLSPRVGQPVEVLLRDGPGDEPGRAQPEDEEVSAHG
jgi:heme exporter protein C